MKWNASRCHLIKMDSIRGSSRILSKFHTIHYDLLEFSEHLFQRTPLDGCFYTIWKHLFFRTPRSGCCFLHYVTQLFFFSRNIFIQRITQKTRTFIFTSMMKENFIIAFHQVLMVTFYVDTFQKLSPIYLGKYLTNSVQN